MASLVRLAAGRLGSALYQATNLTSTPLRLLSTPGWASAQPITTSSFSSPSLMSCSSCLLTSFSSSSPPLPVLSLLQTAQKLSGVMATQGQRSYHTRVALKKRCSSCYFVKRKGRLYVECKAKPRHKQMQGMSKRKIWKEDYSEGFIQRAIFWNYNRDKQYYKLGDSQFARHDWLKGKIGVTV